MFWGEPMSRTTGYLGGGQAKQRSGWLIPLAVFFITACLSALVLAYYFVPEPVRLAEELPAPTDATRAVAIVGGDTQFRIPANYLPLASARQGGASTKIVLAALLPDFDGYDLGSADAFADNGPESRVVGITLHATAVPPPEQQRIERIYSAQLADKDGKPGPYGFREYAFRADSGYHDQDLFVAQTDAGPAIFLCTKIGPDVVSPSCMRDVAFTPGLGLSYRFRRAYLKDWRDIDAKARALVAKFVDKP